MMRTQTQQILKMLPGFIQRLIFSLQKVGDLISQARCFARGKEFGEKNFCQLVPSRYTTNQQGMQLHPRFIPQQKRE